MRKTKGPILLVGASGILGSAFDAIIPAASKIILGRDMLDLHHLDSVIAKVVGVNPSLIINCAADTDVEGAEDAPERAFAVNVGLAGALAKGASESGAAMLHFSSTGCYGDWKEEPYVEDDMLRPTTVHHHTKAVGEEAVLEAHSNALILRLGWIFGGLPEQKKNFVWSRLVETESKSEIGANPRQIGNPTSANDVAALSLSLIEKNIEGIFNCVGPGRRVSRLDYVSEILRAAGIQIKVKPVNFVRRAPVSPNESAINKMLAAAGFDVMPPWHQSLGCYVQELEAYRRRM
ncbi:dTDP-4-dehydrorhamnose reductase (plasmid) [Azospirillum sp. B510]|nr:dTDP-4-dehydrorhamnose reductase [Azospirillum sp. B510]